MNKTIYLEPPLMTLRHTGYRGLLRFCHIEGDGYFFTLTVERWNDAGRWVHLVTQRATPDFFAQEFEALVHTYGADESIVVEPPPSFQIIGGQPRAISASAEISPPAHLREAIEVLFQHYFEDERRDYAAATVEGRDNHIFCHWVSVSNWLSGKDCSPELFLDENDTVNLVPTWLSLLVITLLLPGLLCLPALLIP